MLASVGCHFLSRNVRMVRDGEQPQGGEKQPLWGAGSLGSKESLSL